MASGSNLPGCCSRSSCWPAVAGCATEEVKRRASRLLLIASIKGLRACSSSEDDNVFAMAGVNGCICPCSCSWTSVSTLLSASGPGAGDLRGSVGTYRESMSICWPGRNSSSLCRYCGTSSMPCLRRGSCKRAADRKTSNIGCCPTISVVHSPTRVSGVIPELGYCLGNKLYP
jgi:hypothetical protein